MNYRNWDLGSWYFLLITIGSQLCHGHRNRKRRESRKDPGWPNYGMQKDKVSLEMRTPKC